MWIFAIDTVSAAGCQTLTLQAPDVRRVTELALSVAGRKGWQGASVLDVRRLRRIG